MKIVGKGKFSRVYEDPNDKKRVIIKSTCWVKECLSQNWMPESNMYPSVVREDGDFSYSMMRYEQPRSIKCALTPHHYKMYGQLRDFAEAMQTHSDNRPTMDRLDSLFVDLNIMPKLEQLIRDSVDALSNYGQHPRFEISPRNIAVLDSKLILLDVWFFNECPSYTVGTK
jgi:hypothetical protein